MSLSKSLKGSPMAAKKSKIGQSHGSSPSPAKKHRPSNPHTSRNTSAQELAQSHADNHGHMCPPAPRKRLNEDQEKERVAKDVGALFKDVPKLVVDGRLEKEEVGLKSKNKRKFEEDSDGTDEDKELQESIAKRRRMAGLISPTLGDDAKYTRMGFANMTGVECYRSSLFQALCNAPLFVNWILTSHPPELCCAQRTKLNSGRLQRDCVTCYLREVVAKYWSLPGNAAFVYADKHQRRYTPTAQMKVLQQNINTLFDNLRWNIDAVSGQADPDEQFGWLLEKMETEVSSAAMESFNGIHKMIVKTIITCGACGKTSSRVQEERHLPTALAPKQKPAMIESYIDAYMNDVVHGYKCEKCNKVANNHRTHEILQAPEILLVQLLRFDPSGQRKDSSNVEFEAQLDLDRYNGDKAQGKLIYDLYSVVCHEGRPSFGHYVNFSKIPGGDTWALFNDDSVKSSSFAKASKPTGGSTPYLLFYQRRAEVQR